MKQKTKGILAFAFLGGILLTSTVLFAIAPPAATMTMEEKQVLDKFDFMMNACIEHTSDLENNEQALVACRELATQERNSSLCDVGQKSGDQMLIDDYCTELTLTKTGTPMDNFPDNQREAYCGINDPKSTSFVKEYQIPTLCTQPIAIKVAPDGNVWFIEANVGNIAKFDPVSETFTEFENDIWPEGGTTMSWGMDYSSDGAMWYTDGAYNTIWRFDTINEKYDPIPFPISEKTFPQKLFIHGSDMIVNDFTGNKITFYELSQNTDEMTFSSIVTPIPNAFTGDFAVDSKNNLWFTNWFPEANGFLLNFNIEKYKQNQFLQSTGMEIDVESYFEVYDFPSDLKVANGLSIDENDNVWIVDTASSFFFKFDPNTKEFTKFVTSTPQKSVYGNASGLIKSPTSKPYWTQTDMNGHLFFNEHFSNQIAVFDIENSYLVEYMIPSKNPNWTDCTEIDNNVTPDCGVAMNLGFDVADNQIWFTEWVENKIGVIDTRIPPPFVIDIDKNSITLKKGETQKIILTIDSTSNGEQINFNFAHTASSMTKSSDLLITHDFVNSDEIAVYVTANEIALSGEYKLLLGVYNSEINVSKYVDVIIES